MTWFCCCPRDNTNTCHKPEDQSDDNKSELSQEKPKKRVSFSASEKDEDDDEADSEASYEDVQKYDERQLQNNRPTQEPRKSILLSEKIYYPPTESRSSRLPLQQQRVEASRRMSIGVEPRQDRKQTLLETSKNAGQVVRRETVQKQNLYELLAQK